MGDYDIPSADVVLRFGPGPFELPAASLERCRLYGLPNYTHENPEVWDRLQRWLREHVDKHGFDGIRVDAARHIKRDFIDSIPETGSPIPAFREVVHGDLTDVASFATRKYEAVYNYPLYLRFARSSSRPSSRRRCRSWSGGRWTRRRRPPVACS